MVTKKQAEVSHQEFLSRFRQLRGFSSEKLRILAAEGLLVVIDGPKPWNVHYRRKQKHLDVSKYLVDQRAGRLFTTEEGWQLVSPQPISGATS